MAEIFFDYLLRSDYLITFFGLVLQSNIRKHSPLPPLTPKMAKTQKIMHNGRKHIKKSTLKKLILKKIFGKTDFEFYFFKVKLFLDVHNKN